MEIDIIENLKHENEVLSSQNKALKRKINWLRERIKHKCVSGIEIIIWALSWGKIIYAGYKSMNATIDALYQVMTWKDLI